MLENINFFAAIAGKIYWTPDRGVLLNTKRSGKIKYRTGDEEYAKNKKPLHR